MPTIRYINAKFAANLRFCFFVFLIHTCHVWLPGAEWHIFVFDLVHILRMWHSGCHCQPDAAHRDPGKALGDHHRKDVKVKMTTKCEDTLFYDVNS